MCFKKKKNLDRAFVMIKCPNCGFKYDVQTTEFDKNGKPIVKNSICPNCSKLRTN